MREAERDLAFLAFFSSSELLDADPVRAGATMGSSAVVVAPAPSVSASLGVASMLFFGVEVEADAAASGVGLPA